MSGIRIERLSKVEAKLEKKLKAHAKRYNKNYPGEMIYADTVKLPLLKGETPFEKPERLYVAIDDFSRELYAAILPDKTQYSAAKFLEQVVNECPYNIEVWYTDNGREFQGNPETHAFYGENRQGVGRFNRGIDKIKLVLQKVSGGQTISK